MQQPLPLSLIRSTRNLSPPKLSDRRCEAGIKSCASTMAPMTTEDVLSRTPTELDMPAAEKSAVKKSLAKEDEWIAKLDLDA